jgi:hypothetical protein
MQEVSGAPTEAGGHVEFLRSAAHGFIDAVNRRSAGELLGFCEPDIEWSSALPAGGERGFRGHDGLVGWVTELDRSGLPHEIQVLSVTPLNSHRFMIAGRVMVGSTDVASLVVTATLSENGRIVKAHAYLGGRKSLVALDRD